MKVASTWKCIRRVVNRLQSVRKSIKTFFRSKCLEQHIARIHKQKWLYSFASSTFKNDPGMNEALEKGLVTIERFLGCAESAVSILNEPLITSLIPRLSRLGLRLIDYMLVCRRLMIAYMTWHYFIGLSKNDTVDSAQPRNLSIVTRPFSP